MVFRALILISISFFSLAVSSALASDESAFTDAREKLESGELETALQSYKSIGFTHSLWAQKLEDLIRHHLNSGSSQEAWRIVQLGHRTKRSSAEWKDYERLAVYRSRACPLALPGHDPAVSSLQNAAVYRFHRTLMGRKRTDIGAKGNDSYLGPGLVPELAQISRSRLLSGQGCVFEKLRLSSTSDFERAEFNELMEYINAPGDRSQSAVASLMIRIRALQLAGSLKDKEAINRTSTLLPTENEVPWLDLPDAERRWLFVRLFKAERFVELPENLRSRAQAIALSVLHSTDSAEATDWLAMVDFGSLSTKEISALLSKVEKRGSFKQRAWVLHELAWANYRSGQMNETLTMIRRMLREREEDFDVSLEDSLVELSSRIFTETRFDETLFGATHAALPSRLWGRMAERSLIGLSFSGRAKDFRKISLALSKRPGVRVLREADRQLLEMIVDRRTREFSQRLAGRGKRLDNSLLFLAGEMATKLLDLSGEKELRELAPFARILGQHLLDLSRKPGLLGDEKVDEIGDLAQTLITDTDAWTNAERSVRRGVLKVGIARWTSVGVTAPEFILNAPQTLPLRDLIFIPGKSTGREWIFSTAKN